MNEIVINRGRAEGRATIVAATLLVPLPLAAYTLFRHAPAWQLMWALAVSIYLGLKWLTFVTCQRAADARTATALGYLLLWPGMNAKAFLNGATHVARPAAGEWLLALSKLAGGLLLLYVATPNLGDRSPWMAGWCGMIGLVLVLHFGLFHLLSLCWRKIGIDAPPMMNAPVLASSLSDFWGRRWNLAFRDLAFGHVFRPLVGHLGVVGATMAVFVVSGVIHDVVISGPVHEGWGGPTLYFLVQGAGLLFERSPLGCLCGLERRFFGRLFCGLCTVGPLSLLFHEPFVRGAILPTLAAIKAL